ncbi:S49 family peptidase [Pseudoalteromonas sp. Angola-18]|jgi:protease IV|uniref:S49 family peptidase n=1 Tax=Pseudoalteromonas sp. Angola-18 TaxID=3025338 RepID=UPI002358CC2F|nr:S49 family peptidase [Pseudoalteromonas sp. Angola-18]MDC9502955.1 S49 family peptidase [Pseudoalteromonas sp. Angola-18]
MIKNLLRKSKIKKTSIERVEPENLTQAISQLTSTVESKLGPVAKAYSFSQVFKTFILFGGFITAILINWKTDTLEIKKPKYVSQIKLEGEMTDAGGGSGYNLAKEIQRADADENASAIMLLVNSGGGSPVQGETAYSFIKTYTEKPLSERKPLYVSIQAVCASACYQAISPADKIYAHKSSMVGSIGVRMDSWDFTGLAEKLGIKKQILTSVQKKVLIDPFKQLNDEDEQLLRDALMMPMHNNFVSAVLEARKNKLENDPNLFNGMVWLGNDAHAKGFIDGISSTIEVENELMEITNTKNAKSFNAQGFSLSRLLGGIL